MEQKESDMAVNIHKAGNRESDKRLLGMVILITFFIGH